MPPRTSRSMSRMVSLTGHALPLLLTLLLARQSNSAGVNRIEHGQCDGRWWFCHPLNVCACCLRWLRWIGKVLRWRWCCNASWRKIGVPVASMARGQHHLFGSNDICEARVELLKASGLRPRRKRRVGHPAKCLNFEALGGGFCYISRSWVQFLLYIKITGCS